MEVKPENGYSKNDPWVMILMPAKTWESCPTIQDSTGILQDSNGPFDTFFGSFFIFQCQSLNLQGSFSPF